MTDKSKRKGNTLRALRYRAAAVIGGTLVGLFSFGFIMHYSNDFPALLESIPFAGPWLKMLLAALAGFVGFAITAAAIWQHFEAGQQ
ncbi:MAG: hypothetical protein WB438_04265 [Candidatus Cybelea sp.]